MSNVQRIWIGLAALLALTGCSRAPEPPRPTETLLPDVIGVIVRWEFLDCAPGRYILDSGREIVISTVGDGEVRCDGRLYTPTPRLSDNDVFVSRGTADDGEETTEGDLLFYGVDGDGTPWYAAAHPEDDPDCPFKMRAGAWEEGDYIQLASGLLLPKAEGFTVQPEHVKEPFPLRDGDTICLDATGAVVEVRIFVPF